MRFLQLVRFILMSSAHDYAVDNLLVHGRRRFILRGCKQAKMSFLSGQRTVEGLNKNRVDNDGDWPRMQDLLRSVRSPKIEEVDLAKIPDLQPVVHDLHTTRSKARSSSYVVASAPSLARSSSSSSFALSSNEVAPLPSSDPTTSSGGLNGSADLSRTQRAVNDNEKKISTSSSLSIVVYHATRRCFAESILKHGFRFPLPQEGEDRGMKLGSGIYFGVDKEYCRSEAENSLRESLKPFCGCAQKNEVGFKATSEKSSENQIVLLQVVLQPRRCAEFGEYLEDCYLQADRGIKKREWDWVTERLNAERLRKLGGYDCARLSMPAGGPGSASVSAASSVGAASPSSAEIKDAARPKKTMIASDNIAVARVIGGCEAEAVDEEDHAESTTEKMSPPTSSVLINTKTCEIVVYDPAVIRHVEICEDDDNLQDGRPTAPPGVVEQVVVQTEEAGSRADVVNKKSERLRPRGARKKNKLSKKASTEDGGRGAEG